MALVMLPVRRSARRHIRQVQRGVTSALLALAMLAGVSYAAVADTGVDVSGWQHLKALNWSKAKADGVTYAFIKATEGRTYTNPYFDGDWSATHRLGIYHGAYHFARPSKGSAAAQARYFVRVAGLQSGHGVLPPVLDLEVNGGLGVKALRRWTHVFLRHVEDLTGRAPMIYVSPSFWEQNLGNSGGFHHYPLWVAHYGVRSPRVPGGWPTWTFWQKTSSGRIAGIAGRVDINRFNGGSKQLARMANVSAREAPSSTTGATSPSPSPTTLTLKASRYSVYGGTTVRLHGRLHTATGALTDKPVTLWRQLPGADSATRIDRVTTGKYGKYLFHINPARTASYVVKWAGGKRYGSSTSPARTVNFLDAEQTTLTVAATRRLIYPGQSTTLTGSLLTSDAAVPGRVAQLWRQREGAVSQTKVKSVKTSKTGRYAFKVAPRATATWTVTFGGGSRYASSSSLPVKLTYRPTIPTSVTLGASRSGLYPGQTVALSGSLSSDLGSLDSQQVDLFKETGNQATPTKVATLTTDGSGRFFTAIAPTSTATYTARYAGATTYDPAASSDVAVKLLPQEPTTLTGSMRRTTINAGHGTRFHGLLRITGGHALAGRRVVIYRRVAGQDTWRRVGRVHTSENRGHWVKVLKPRLTSTFKAVWKGTPRYPGSHTHRIRVRVR